MPALPLLNKLSSKRKIIDTFLGYDHNLKIRDGAFYEMENMSSSFYPLLANRPARAVLQTLESPGGITAKSGLIWIDGGRVYLEGQCISGDIQLSDSEKSLVSMGAYLLIFPDKVYINCENPADRGYIEAAFESGGPVTYSLCMADGGAYGETTKSDTAPEAPVNGQLWIDTSAATHSLKQYSSASEMWVTLEAVYTKIESPGIGAAFRKNDAVSISGCAFDKDAQIAALNGTKLIHAAGEDFIIVQNMLSNYVEQSEGTVKISRKMPDMDFVTECENRLWGCKYGIVDGNPVNEIYACALGDFRNWHRFSGLADDSWAASVGTDGPFTAACSHLGYPIFFKENALHKVYISADGAHRIADSACRGVQAGSHRSLAVVGEKLYYRSARHICVYEGSLPRSVSAALGDIQYNKAVGGALGDKYYVSMESAAGPQLFVYDTQRGLWHREDDLRVRAFASHGAELYALDDRGRILSMLGSRGEREKACRWAVDTGPLGFETVERKFVGRLILRMKLPVGSFADVYMEYDSDGVWSHAGHIQGRGTGSFSLPLRPRRCDHFRLRLTGYGDVRVYSMSKVLESGSDY